MGEEQGEKANVGKAKMEERATRQQVTIDYHLLHKQTFNKKKKKISILRTTSSKILFLKKNDQNFLFRLHY